MAHFVKLTALILCIGIGIGILGCKNKYEKLVAEELAKSIRQDTLFMGIEFGMNSREFFAYCWDLNRSGLVSEGSTNNSVLYKLARFGKRYDINFYPIFDKDKIVSLPVEYSYEVYAPWKPAYSIDTLFNEVGRMQKELYGDDFLVISDPKRGVALVRVDGNRRISIFKNEVRTSVTVLYRDLSVEIENSN